MNNDRSSRWAIPLLLFGGFAAGIGWFVGLVLLWDSRAWTVGDKLLGTFVVPFGLAGSVFFASALAGSVGKSTCAFPHGSRCVWVSRTISSLGVFGHVAAVLVLIAPIAVAYYLHRHRRNRLIGGPILG